MPTTGESVGVVALLSLALKLLLLPSYQSVEFVRQKTWLAITHELKLQDWYFENVEPWNLNYPPMFAYFKYFLSFPASLFVEPEMLQLNNTSPSSHRLVVFERLSVIVMDSPLLFGVLLYCTTWPSTTTTDMEWSRNKVVVVVALILFNPGLIMVDHIFLHYTGYAVGIFFISLALLRRGDELGDILGVMVFVVLLMFDHTFLPALPLFALYLYRHFCCVCLPNSALTGSRSTFYKWRRSSVSSSDGLLSDDFTSDTGNEEDDESESFRVQSLIRRISLRRQRRQVEQQQQQQQQQQRRSEATMMQQGVTEREEACSEGVLLAQMRAEVASYSSNHVHDVPQSEELGRDSKGGKQPRVFDSPRSEKSYKASRPRRKSKKKHQRTCSDIPGGFRFQEAYDKLRTDASFKNLLQRPRSNSSSLEIVLDSRTFQFSRLLVLSLVIFLTVALVWLPLFVAHGNPGAVLSQVFHRLYPPNATMCRSYWAPNFWAIYSGLDKGLVFLAQSWDLFPGDVPASVILDNQPYHNSTLFLLPVPTQGVCAALVFLAMLPALSQVWRHPHQSVLLPAFVYCMTCAFMLGFHTHEKSVLMTVVPLTLASCDSTMDARLFLLMSWIAHVSLLPILETPDLKTLKPVMIILHCFASFIALDQYHIMARRARRIRPEPNGGGVWLSLSDRRYFRGLAMIYFFAEVIHPVIPFFGAQFWPDVAAAAENFAFLPLMIISLYCAAGMMHCWTLAHLQLERKVAVIESYQWSPHGPRPAPFFQDASSREVKLSRLSLFS